MSAITVLSRPARARWRTPVAILFVLATMAGGLADGMAPAGASSGLAGSVYHDDDRDGRRTDGEAGFDDLSLHLLTEDRSELVASTTTDEHGGFTIPDVADGSYVLQMASSSWWALDDDWTPTNTGTLQPRLAVTVSGGSGDASLGLRGIVRSSDPDAPITATTAVDGMALRSYNDVVPAGELHEVLMEGSLVGPEAAAVTIRHDLSGTTTCSGVASWDGEAYTSYRATCSISWSYWLSGGHTAIFHEYGHAWSMYHAYVTQQDPHLLGYLDARGIDPDDERIGTSHAWSVREMIAEDYRQLFGSPKAQASPQENQDIPAATDVPGLLEYLRDDFTTAPTSTEDQTAPSGTIITPADGATVVAGEPVDVSVQATDDTSMGDEVSVTILVDGTAQTTLSYDPEAAVYAGTVDTSDLPAGPHQVVAHLSDQARNTASTEPVEIVVDEPEPTSEPAPTAPDAPTDLIATDNGDGSVTLTWADNADDEDGVEVAREEQHRNGRWRTAQVVTVTDADVDSFTDAPGAGTFRYTVRAFNDAGTSDAISTTVDVTSDSASSGGGGKCHPKKGC